MKTEAVSITSQIAQTMPAANSFNRSFDERRSQAYVTATMKCSDWECNGARIKAAYATVPKGIARTLKKSLMGTVALSILFLAGCASAASDAPDHDPTVIEAILEDVRVGWEEGDAEPFYTHFLDWDGARYFEGGGENVGLQDLVEHHVEPEAELDLRLGLSNIQIHFEGDFAWAVVDTDIRLTMHDGHDIHNRGHATYLFRWTDGTWKIVHTQSSSSPVQSSETGTP